MKTFLPAFFLLFFSFFNKAISQQYHDDFWIEHTGVYKDMSWIPQAVFFVDSKPAAYTDVQKLHFDSIIKIEVYKRKEALLVFGREGKTGMVLITTMNKFYPSFPVYYTDDSAKYYINNHDTIFIHLSETAGFIGGADAWQEYLQRHLDAYIPGENNAPAGAYKAAIKFIVNKDGSVSDLDVLYDPGYGTAWETLRVVQAIKKWQPAFYNGKPVRSVVIQPLTFMVNIR